MTAPAVDAPIVPIRTLEAAFTRLLAEFGVTPTFNGEQTAAHAPALLALVASVYGATTMQMPTELWETYSLYRQWIAPQSLADLEWLSGVAS